MAVTTWDEALEGLTPQEVMALRKIRMHLRRFLLSKGVNYSTRKPRFKDGYGGLERFEFYLHGAVRVIRSDDVSDASSPMNALFLALDETIYSYGEELLKEDE